MIMKQLAMVVTIGLLGLALSLLGLYAALPDVAQAVDISAPLGEITVCLAGPPDCQFDSIQAAVDAANEGDVVKVATGVYTGVQGRPSPPGYPWPVPSGIITQVVYISKTLTIRGGYTAPDFSEPPDPQVNPTTVDAQDQGRALFITGEISPTVEGLRICGGGVDDEIWLSAKGGGITILGAAAIIRNNQVFGNVGLQGGGLYLWGSAALVSDNTITGNSGLDGGGLALESSNATISSNVVSFNDAPSMGGGLWLRRGSDATLLGNIVSGNEACHGSGIEVDESHAVLINNVVTDNQLRTEDPVCTQGSGLRISASSAHLLQNTIARNTGSTGVYIEGAPSSSAYSTVALTNTVLVSHSVGISITGGNMVTANAVLWHTTSITVSQSVTAVVTMQNQYNGDPAFAAGGYHLTAGSAAIDKGVDAGVVVDIDGEPRPAGAGYDLGADELWFKVYLPLVLRNR